MFKPTHPRLTPIITLMVALVVGLLPGGATPSASHLPTVVSVASSSQISVVEVPSATSSTAAATPKRVVAYQYAKSKKGKPYRYGGTGPSSYDCSGLTMMAYRHAGISLPRTADSQHGSSKTVHTSHAPRYGDLVFWSGHVMFFVKFATRNGRRGYWVFGARHTGTRIGYVWYPGRPHVEHVRGAG